MQGARYSRGSTLIVENHFIETITRYRTGLGSLRVSLHIFCHEKRLNNSFPLCQAPYVTRLVVDLRYYINYNKTKAFVNCLF